MIPSQDTIDFITATKLLFQIRSYAQNLGLKRWSVSFIEAIQLPVVIFYYVQYIRKQVKMDRLQYIRQNHKTKALRKHCFVCFGFVYFLIMLSILKQRVSATGDHHDNSGGSRHTQVEFYHE